jgi:hypothetical protein
LVKKGYVLASSIGRARTESSLTPSDSIGLLMPQPDNPESQDFSFRPRGVQQNPKRRRFVGIIWFSNYARGANRRDWVIEVYGKEYFELLQVLGRKLWSTFCVSVEVRLIKDFPENEIFLSDFDSFLKDQTISEEGAI